MLYIIFNKTGNCINLINLCILFNIMQYNKYLNKLSLLCSSFYKLEEVIDTGHRRGDREYKYVQN